ncbi:glycine--tRNA ligase subunit alpha [Candidatus Carsonella ruddii]|uniref:Glycine--tRNA ligase alpha subunit n=1 Tax=Carsonella ruddii TaxID=114186 RepID=A0A1U9RST0_CARRU|nr:glycine--tRNA ligase subunit alpha [Candidatus Carsonella ruddii]AQU89611.1 Glycyl-tRNA synthetase alpha chain [Candidatus Carsonella ruddii]
MLNKILYYWKNKKFFFLKKTDNKSGAATYNYINVNFLIKKKIFTIYFKQNCYRQFDSYLFKKKKLSIHNQLQIICKPIPINFLTIYKNSLYFFKNIFFIKDNWKSPLLGAKGLGYEVIYNNIEISQITIFFFFGNKKLNIPILEITYGIDRINNFKKTNFIKEKFFSLDNIFNKFSIKKILFLYNQCLLNFKNKNIFISYFFFIKITNNFNLIDEFYLSNNYNRIKIINLIKIISKNIIKKIND